MTERSGAPQAVPDIVAPPPHHPRFPLSDGIRGIAAVAVLVVHSWLFAGGFGGFTGSLANRAVVRLDAMVAIFFMLSAFLLYRPMIAHRGGGPSSPSVADYARRRFLRIYPPFWVVLTALAIFPGLFGVFGGHWWAFYSLGFYLHPYYAANGCPTTQTFLCGLPQTWTLTVEMTFYIVLPLYVFVTARLARGQSVGQWMQRELMLLAGLAALSLFMNGAPLSFRHKPWFEFTFIGHFYWISLGLAMAVLSVGYGHGRRDLLPRALRAMAAHPGACWAGAFAIYLITVFSFFPAPFTVAPMSSLAYLALNLLQGAAAALLVVPVVFGNPNRGLPSRVLGNAYMLWLGVISYGLYLWQVTLQAKLGFEGAGFLTILGVTLVIATPLAALTYYAVERPLMRLKYHHLRDLVGRRPRAARAAGGDS
jgi:peptidoglycan/LPS O-acetylase OafA/YrhL